MLPQRVARTSSSSSKGCRRSATTGSSPHNCDAYASLHRAEGFGLTIADAMALGKPVVATGYSGNLEFMTDANGYLVPSTLVSDPGGSRAVLGGVPVG